MEGGCSCSRMYYLQELLTSILCVCVYLFIFIFITLVWNFILTLLLHKIWNKTCLKFYIDTIVILT